MIAIERLQRRFRRKVAAARLATVWRLLLLAGLIHATAGSASAASAVWELAPYRVRALVTITPTMPPPSQTSKRCSRNAR